MENKIKVIKGQLMGYYETGMEGEMWALQELGKSYDGLHNIQKAKHLKVYRHNKVIYDQDVDFVNYTEKKINTLDGVITKQIYWHFGMQKDIDENIWFQMFNEELEAEITM